MALSSRAGTETLRHYGCRYTSTPSTRADFLRAKFEANAARDSAIRGVPLAAGWRVATLCECALRKAERISLATGRLSAWLPTETDALESGEGEASAPPSGGEDVSSSSLLAPRSKAMLGRLNVRSGLLLSNATDIQVRRRDAEEPLCFCWLQATHQARAVMRSGEYRPERPLPGQSAQRPVLSPSRITRKYNEKIRPPPDRENAFAGASGGDEGIRTLETVSRLHP